MAEGENGFSVPEIELIIKASTIDGRRKGACIFCQEYFMDLYLLAGTYIVLQFALYPSCWYYFNLPPFLIAELKTISLKITTVDMKRPPADFRFSKNCATNTNNHSKAPFVAGTKPFRPRIRTPRHFSMQGS